MYKSNNKDTYIKDHPRIKHYPQKQRLYNSHKGHWTAERVDLVDGPEESFTVLAGYIFTLGRIVKEVPYDPNISFMGEELCFTIRAWTRDWKIYSPDEMYVWHHYHRRGHHRIWDSSNNSDKKWGQIEKLSMMRQMKVYSSENLGIFGVPSADKMRNFEKFACVEVEKEYKIALQTKLKLSESQLEQEVLLGTNGIELTSRMSIPCEEGDHEDTETPCITEGCECECHKK